MANKTTGNFIGIGDDYSATSGIWTATEARERSLNPAHSNWGGAQIIELDFLLIAGGGGGGAATDTLSRSAGGGAGGYITSYGAAGSAAAGSNPVASINYSLVQSSPALTVTIGAGGNTETNGSNSIFSGRDADNVIFNHEATGGGRGGGNAVDGSTGGSGGGNGHRWLGNGFNVGSTSTNAGTSNQGSAGGGTWGTTPSTRDNDLCVATNSSFWCAVNTHTYAAGGGGGAGAAASNANGGNGAASDITGSSVVRAGGGYGKGQSNANGTAGTGQNAAGGGGNALSAGNNGTLIIRYPVAYNVSFNTNQLTGTTVTDGTHKVTTFTAGSSTISFTAA